MSRVRVLGRCEVGLAAIFVSGLVTATASAATVSFTTQGCSVWSAPTGVTSVQIDAVGASGGPGGGNGDGVSGTLSHLAGQSLDVCVDAGGNVPYSGASGVAVGSDFSRPVLVAGGGGMAGLSGSGGNAGMPIAGSGKGPDGTGGRGGNNRTHTPGAGGKGPGIGGFPGSPGGKFNASGPGMGGFGARFEGGFGGAGYYGGGGGGYESPFAIGGGGGGTDFCGAVTGCKVAAGAGTQAAVGTDPGDAIVTITYGGLLDPTSTAVGCPGVCTATVTDTAATPTRPTGVVRFTSVPAAGFLPGSCRLQATKTVGVASCTVGMIVGGKKTYVVTASYLGDISHAASSGTGTRG